MTPELISFETELLNDVPSLMAVRSGFRFGLFRKMLAGPLTDDDLMRDAGLSETGAAMLLQIFGSSGIAMRGDDGWTLSDDMHALLIAAAEDLRVKADFTAMAVSDTLNHSELLLRDAAGFLQTAQTFKFFRYDRAMGTGAAHLQDTAPWVDYVSALTRREGPELARHIDLTKVRNVVEIGGNTGVFAQELVTRNPSLKVCVVDLPAVCRLGEKRVQTQNVASRIRFVAGDAREITWPKADVVLFKSVLHDWSQEGAAMMLGKAAKHVPLGGRIIVCERGPIADEETHRGALAATNLVFGQYYRDPQFYRDCMADCGLKILPSIQVRLDMVFHLTIGERIV